MKLSNLVIVAHIVFGVFCVAFLAAYPDRVETASKVVSLKVSSDRTNYKLGEIIEIETRITNNSSKTIEVGGDSKSWATVKIADGQGKDYKIYVAPPDKNSITLDGINFGVFIRPYKTYSRKQTILWNYKPDVAHLSSDASKSYTDGRILTEYAFPVSGKYFVKLFSHIELNGISVDYDSQPLEINVSEPTGIDADIWNEIKSNADIGYFMQEADLVRGRYYKQAERDEFQLTIQNLISENPKGIYAEKLQRSLHVFRLEEMKQGDYRKLLGR